MATLVSINFYSVKEIIMPSSYEKKYSKHSSKILKSASHSEEFFEQNSTKTDLRSKKTLKKVQFSAIKVAIMHAYLGFFLHDFSKFSVLYAVSVAH